jgi:hypothetical protein
MDQEVFFPMLVIFVKESDLSKYYRRQPFCHDTQQPAVRYKIMSNVTFLLSVSLQIFRFW